MISTVSPASTTPAAALPERLFVQALDVCRGPLVLCDVRSPGHPVVFWRGALLVLLL